MRKVIFPIAFLGSAFLAACSFSFRAGGEKQPQNPPPPPPQPTQQAAAPRPAPTPVHPVAQGPIRHIGKRTSGPVGPTPAPTNTSTAPTPGPTPPPSGGATVVNAPTIFGNGTVDPNGFKGNLYWLDKGVTKLPALDSLKPAGFVFTSELNVTPQAFSSGFPGVDPARKENFAIRYEAPLVISAEADYDFRLVADDGAVLRIDNTPILDNDGVKAAPATKEGPVHLVPGTHLVQIDYLQTSGPVALQLFWRKANETTDALFHPGAGAAPAPAPTPSGSASPVPSTLPSGLPSSIPTSLPAMGGSKGGGKN